MALVRHRESVDRRSLSGKPDIEPTSPNCPVIIFLPKSIRPTSADPFKDVETSSPDDKLTGESETGSDGENKRGGPKTTASQDRSCDKHQAELLDFQPDPISGLAGHEQTLCPRGELLRKRAADDLSPNLLDLSDAILLCHRGDSAHLSTQ